MSSILRLFGVVTTSLLVFTLPCLSFAQAPDPQVNYIVVGESVAPWKVQIGNSLGWHDVVDRSAESTRGNIVVRPATKTVENDAIHIKWAGKKLKEHWSITSLKLSKNSIDLSQIKDKAALVLEIRVIRPPTKITSIKMRCNWKGKECEAGIQLKSVLKKLPKKKWTYLPLPLKCFDRDGFDFTKVTDIVDIGTKGKMEIEIASIGLSALPEGQKIKCGKK